MYEDRAGRSETEDGRRRTENRRNMADRGERLCRRARIKSMLHIRIGIPPMNQYASRPSSLHHHCTLGIESSLLIPTPCCHPRGEGARVGERLVPRVGGVPEANAFVALRAAELLVVFCPAST